MRAVDLAFYADELAARSATLAAQLERARGRLRQAAIEREARRALDDGLVARLESLGFLRGADTKTIRAEVVELASAVAAVEELQAWVERRLYAAREGLTLSAE
jgi:Fe2+ transport system protein FeoA